MSIIVGYKTGSFQQLAETLKREIPEVHVTAVEVENIGMCIRYAPLETSYSEYCYPIRFVAEIWLCGSFDM